MSATTTEKPVKGKKTDETATAPAPSTNGPKTTASLAEQVKNLKATQEDTLEQLRTQRAELSEQIVEIDELLAELGYPEQAGSAASPAKPASVRGSGPRGGREMTIASAVEALTLKYKAGLGRADLVGKMMSEMDFKPAGDPSDPDTAKKFVNTVYTGGINKNVTEGKIIPCGQRPNTVYKHVNNCTKAEIEAYKGSKK